MVGTLNLEMSLAGMGYGKKLFDLNPGKKVESDKRSEIISERYKQNNKVIVVKKPGKLKR